MMKNLTKAALLMAAATAFLLVACSHSSGGGDKFSSRIKVVSAEELGASAESAESSDASVVTAAVEDGGVKLTSKKEGSATVTAKANGYNDATISVTVSANGEIKAEVTQGFEPAGDPNFPSKTDESTANDETTLGLVGTSTDSSNPSIATAKIEGDKIVITSHGAGSATITVKDADEHTAGIEVSVAADGTITIGEITKYEDKTVTGKTYAWDFQAAGLTSILSYTNNDDGKPQLDAAGTYESTPAGLTLNLPEGGVFNKVEPTTAVSSTVQLDGVTKGLIEPDGQTLLTVDVKGPFTAVMLCAANASSDKTDRYAYITVNGEEVCAPGKETNTLPAAGQKLAYTYEGSDTVTVGFGGTNYVRIHDIQITTANGDSADKTAGEVKSKATFVSQTDDSTANDVATLGLVGTSADSSDKTVATAKIDDGKIVITSVGAGTATITVKDSSNNEATIEVTVGGTGKITIGKTTKYVNTADIFTIENGVLNLVADKYEYYLSKENLEATTGNNAWSTASSAALANTTDKAGKTTFTQTIAAVNMSKPERNITLKVKNVAAIDVHVFDSNGGRDYTVQVGSNSAVTYQSVKNKEGNVIKTETTDEVEIVMAGVSQSVYPVGVILYKEAPQE